MIETRTWKKIRGSVECDKCRLCGSEGSEYVTRFNNILKVLAVKGAVENGLLPEDTKLYTTNRERGKMIEKDGKKLF